jgi:hypothetical protein
MGAERIGKETRKGHEIAVMYESFPFSMTAAGLNIQVGRVGLQNFLM